MSTGSLMKRMDARPTWLVIMGVSGCGKSTLAKTISYEFSLPFIEGDDFHSPGSVDRMLSGIPLSDADRRGWLDRLVAALRTHENGAVLSCSCLMESYRQRLRTAVEGLKFVYLKIDPGDATARVASRAGHVFPTSLVDSQFAILEPPLPGTDILVLSAVQAPSTLCAEVSKWIGCGTESRI